MTIGIITGSGPEAGLDLWAKVLHANRRALGTDYHGDQDAPAVIIRSDPRLSASMDLEHRHGELWPIVADAAQRLGNEVDHFTIACNTLTWFGPRLGDLGLDASFVTHAAVAADHVRAAGLERVGLLGARQTMGLGEWSAYRSLTTVAQVVVPEDSEPLHQLIHRVKLAPDDPAHARALAAIVDGLEVEVALLACTELPLVAPDTDTELVDVTELVAAELVRRSLDERGVGEVGGQLRQHGRPLAG